MPGFSVRTLEDGISRTRCHGPRQRFYGSVAVALTLGAVAACDEGTGKTDVKSKAPDGPLVEVPGGNVEVGFAIGVLRESKKVEAFTISRFPVTRGEFLACVQAGACTRSPGPRCLPSGSTDRLDRPTLDDDQFPAGTPATCVGLDEAEKYCAWAGGRLPTLEQWTLAARGATIARYAWGGSAPTCEQHPRAAKITETERTFCELSDPAPLEVGKHSAGASPLGVQDVLLTRAELLRASQTSLFGACEQSQVNGQPGSGACLVYGLEAGAIDSVQPMPVAAALEDGTPGVEVSPSPYGFRCVWSEEVSQ